MQAEITALDDSRTVAEAGVAAVEAGIISTLKSFGGIQDTSISAQGSPSSTAGQMSDGSPGQLLLQFSTSPFYARDIETDDRAVLDRSGNLREATLIEPEPEASALRRP